MSKPGMPKSRLGRGLSSLINVSPAAAPAETSSGRSTPPEAPIQGAASEVPGVRVLEVSIDDISPNPHQPRRRFDEAALRELAESIKTTGMIQPVVARGTPDGGYELIAGERRWRAAKLAGLTALPVIVRTVDPVMQAQMALVENIQRQDLNAIDRATAYKALLDNLGLTQTELADRLGEERTAISHYLRLLDLAPAVQEMVADGRLSLGHAKVLAGVSDAEEQVRLAELVLRDGLNVRKLEALTSAPGGVADVQQPEQGSSAHIGDLEKNLSRQLGMRVQVQASKQKGRGKLVVHYGSLDQFDDLLNRLGVRPE